MLFNTSAPNGGQYPMVEVKGRPLGNDEDWYEPRGGWAWNVFGVAFQGRTYKNLAFMLISLPLATLYFTISITLLSAGGGALIVLVGIPLLLALLYGAPIMAEIERHLSNGLLGTRIRPLRFEEPRRPGAWEHIVSRLRSGSSWQAIAYTILKFPLAVVGFSIVTAFVTAGFSPISVPVVAIWAEVDWGIWTIETWEEGLLPAVFAPLTIFVALHVANGAAWVTARITEGLLQPWSTPTARAGTAAPAPPQGTPGSTPEAATHVVPPVAEQAPDHAAAPAMATGPDGAMVPLAERARRTAATITDRVQAVTDDLGERARAAARGWSAASTASGAATADSAPAPEATTPQAPATDTAGHEPPEPGDDERVDGEQEDTGEPARVTVDVVMRIVTVNDEEIELTPKEFDLIVLFVSNPGRPFSRDELLDRIWRNDYEVTDRTIDTHIQRLRKKLGPGAELIQTIWGVGYKYQPPREQA